LIDSGTSFILVPSSLAAEVNQTLTQNPNSCNTVVSFGGEEKYTFNSVSMSLTPNKEDFFVLGVEFLQGRYTNFDIKNRRIGFAAGSISPMKI